MKKWEDPYRVGFTGTARGQVTRAQLEALFVYMSELREEYPGGIEWHHGGAHEADAKAHLIATAMGFRTVVHPGPRSDPRDFPYADVVLPWKPNLDRDTDIARAGRELVAVPWIRREQLRSGTWTTVRRARAFRRSIILILPDGTVTDDVAEHTT